MSTETKSEDRDVVVLNWEGKFRFEAIAPSGNRLVFDSSTEHGGEGSAISPLEALIAAAAGCSAIDIVSVLQKKRQNLEKYRVEVDWDRRSEGDWPRPITAIRITHILSGEGLDEAAVRHAVELSDAKYCTVIATLRAPTDVSSHFRIE